MHDGVDQCLGIPRRYADGEHTQWEKQRTLTPRQRFVPQSTNHESTTSSVERLRPQSQSRSTMDETLGEERLRLTEQTHPGSLAFNTQHQGWPPRETPASDPKADACPREHAATQTQPELQLLRPLLGSAVCCVPRKKLEKKKRNVRQVEEHQHSRTRKNVEMKHAQLNWQDTGSAWIEKPHHT